MHRWYIIHVVSGQENHVKKELEQYLEVKGMSDFISEILIPTENVSEVKQGQQRISEKRMWPGYLFVQMDLTNESQAYVQDTPKVLGFLGGETPTPLSDQEVADTLRQLEERKKTVVQKHKVEVGDKVKITDGVFINFIGVVIEVNHERGRLNVLVSIFGRDTRVEDLEFWQVEQSATENAN